MLRRSSGGSDRFLGRQGGRFRFPTDPLTVLGAIVVTMSPTESRRRWPRLTLVLPPEQSEALGQLARSNYRDPKREALRLLVDGIERETQKRSAVSR